MRPALRRRLCRAVHFFLSICSVARFYAGKHCPYGFAAFACLSGAVGWVRGVTLTHPISGNLLFTTANKKGVFKNTKTE